jgi:pyruvate formate lyase activating enzyme
LIDYAPYVAATVFTPGCNFKCGFCHNSGLLDSSESYLSSEAVLEELRKRAGFIDAVCVTGGEPCLHGDALFDFLKELRALGLKIKLDSNGSLPDVLKSLVEKKLVDKVAMDIKSDKDHYSEVCGVDCDLEAVCQSVDYLRSGKVFYEFRTTVVPGYHDVAVMENIAKWIAGADLYYLQGFRPAETVVDVKLRSVAAVSDQVLQELRKVCLDYVKTEIR